MNFEGETPTQENKNEIQGQEAETGIESQEVDEELVERIVGELTEKLEGDVESLRNKVKEREEMGRDEETGEIKASHLTDVNAKRDLLEEEERWLNVQKDRIKETVKGVLLMSEKRSELFEMLKERLEKMKRETETKGYEPDGYLKERIQIIEMVEKAKEEVEK